MGPAPRDLTPELDAYGAQAVEEGWTTRQIAQRVGLGQHLARRFRREARERFGAIGGQTSRPKSHLATDDSHLNDESDGDTRTITSPKGWRVKSLDDLLEAAEVDTDTWRVTRHRVNTWEQSSKDLGIVTLHQVTAQLERRLVADVQPARCATRVSRLPRPWAAGPRCAVIIPDSQHGFRWSKRHTYLDPLHDRRACDAVTQLIAMVQPDEVILLGDMLDLAAWSTKFPRPLDLRDTTQPTLEELHWQLAQWRMAAPSARMRWVEGNHEARIRKALTEQMVEATTVHQVGDERVSVLDLPHLLRLDMLECEYVAPYGEEFWLWDRIRIGHGWAVRKGGGATAAANLKAATHSMVWGHSHRMESAQKCVWGPDGPRTITALSPGCLCRTDGAVPGDSRPDWQNGVTLAWLDSTGQEHLQNYPIHNGRLVYSGCVLEGQDRSREIADTTGWRQIAGLEAA